MRIKINETPHDSQINTTIKPIDEKKATAELEKGEIVFDPNKLTLHKVLGKRHSAGGTPVNLDPGTFIFSDFKKLKIKEKDAKIMEFKKGGTPSKILSKEINIKHHNTMVDILQNQKGDEVSNNSAELMLKKNMDKVGQVAFLQEEKKRFPQGKPEFSKGTAPVYSRDINSEIMKSKQYAVGGLFDPLDYECKCGRDVNGNCNPCGDNDPRLATVNAPLVNTVPKGYTPYGTYNNSTYYTNSQSILGNNSKLMSNTDWTKYLANETPAQKQRRLIRQSAQSKGFIDKAVRTEDNIPTPRPFTPETIIPTRAPGTPNIIPRKPPVASNDPDLPVIAKYPKIGLTDYQKLDLGRQAIGALSVKRYDPIRQQQESVITQPELMSAQPYLNQINQGYFNAANSLKSLTNPSQVIAGNRELYGNRLDQSNKVIGDIENQNVSLLNASKMNNANILNSDAVANRGFDQKYYNDTILSRQNYDNLKDIATDNLYNGFNDTMGEVQTMQNMINSQRAIKTDVPIYDKNGKQTGWEGQLPILPQKGFLDIQQDIIQIYQEKLYLIIILLVLVMLQILLCKMHQMN